MVEGLGEAGVLEDSMQLISNWQTMKRLGEQQEFEHTMAERQMALDVAKLDASLATGAHNWLEHAAWLRASNIPVNAMSLAISARTTSNAHLAAAAGESSDPVNARLTYVRVRDGGTEDGGRYAHRALRPAGGVEEG